MPIPGSSKHLKTGRSAHQLATGGKLKSWRREHDDGAVHRDEAKPLVLFTEVSHAMDVLLFFLEVLTAQQGHRAAEARQMVV